MLHKHFILHLAYTFQIKYYIYVTYYAFDILCFISYIIYDHIYFNLHIAYTLHIMNQFIVIGMCNRISSVYYKVFSKYSSMYHFLPILISGQTRWRMFEKCLCVGRGRKPSTGLPVDLYIPRRCSSPQDSDAGMYSVYSICVCVCHTHTHTLTHTHTNTVHSTYTYRGTTAVHKTLMQVEILKSVLCSDYDGTEV